MSDKAGAWIGVGIMTAAAIITKENAWYSLLMLWVVLAY